MNKITLVVDTVHVEYSSARTKVEVEISGFDCDDVISEVGSSDLLSCMDIDDVKSYLESEGYEVKQNE